MGDWTMAGRARDQADLCAVRSRADLTCGSFELSCPSLAASHQLTSNPIANHEDIK